MESFKRQLNLYGFRKIVPYNGSYYHKYFRKGHKESLKMMERKRKRKYSSLELSTSDQSLISPESYDENNESNDEICKKCRRCNRSIFQANKKPTKNQTLVLSPVEKTENLHWPYWNNNQNFPVDGPFNHQHNSFLNIYTYPSLFNHFGGYSEDAMNILSSFDERYEDLGIKFSMPSILDKS
jgi:hypothetical protein